jgi:hypothetical protein
MGRKLKYLSIVVAVLLVSVPVFAQSSTKSFSTNFTLVNLGPAAATGMVQYIKSDGTAWRADESFALDPLGGQAIFRQYTAGGLGYIADAGQGSAVVSADQPLGGVVQILARGQSPTTSGAYSGFSAGDSSFYVPLVARKLGTASGEANSQIVVQNTGSSGVTVEIRMIGPTGASVYLKQGVAIAAGASYMYDLAIESATNVPNGWYGSAVVSVVGAGEVAVVSNFFTGDAMQTFNAFGAGDPGQKWYVPLFTSRLPNTLSTPIAVQNLSGGTIAANGVTVTCTPDPTASGASSFTLKNTSQILNSAAYYFNPVVDNTIPANWYGSCVVDATANVVVFVQMRFIATGEAAAYEGIRAGGTDAKVIIPLVAKRLPNGFATAVTIQNLSSTGATVKLTYTPSADYAGSQTPLVIQSTSIAGNASLIQNHRVETSISGINLPDGWFGTLVVESNQPVSAFVQLTFLRNVNPGLPQGDNFMAHNAFTIQ